MFAYLSTLSKECRLGYFKAYKLYKGGCDSTVVKALRYKSEGRWFDCRWCNWDFSLT